VIGKTRWIEIQALWSRVDRDWRRLAQSKVIRRLKIRLLLLDLARCRLTGDDVGIVDNLIDLGRFMGDDGQLDASERAFLEARHRAVTKDYELAIARTGIGLAAIALVRQNHDLAVKLLEGELPRTRRIPDRIFLADALLKLGEANAQLGRMDLAAVALGEAESVAGSNGDWGRRARALDGLGSIATVTSATRTPTVTGPKLSQSTSGISDCGPSAMCSIGFLTPRVSWGGLMKHGNWLRTASFRTSRQVNQASPLRHAST